MGEREGVTVEWYLEFRKDCPWWRLSRRPALRLSEKSTLRKCKLALECFGEFERLPDTQQSKVRS